MTKIVSLLILLFIAFPLSGMAVLEEELRSIAPPQVNDPPPLVIQVPAGSGSPQAPVSSFDSSVQVPAGNLTMPQTYQLFRSIGASVAEAILGTALCKAENGKGNPLAVGINKPPAKPDYGLCQINGMHVPALAPSVEALLDPLVSVTVTLRMLRSGGPTQWCTYPGGCGGLPGVPDWVAIFAQAAAVAARFGG